MASRFRQLRILFMLLLLAAVALYSLHGRLKLTSWQDTLTVRIYPINGDGSPRAEKYIGRLNPKRYAWVERFINAEARRYLGVEHDVIRMELGPPLAHQPPPPPLRQSLLNNVQWSLSFRYWAYEQRRQIDGDDADIALFVLYFDPNEKPVLGHSVGLPQAGLGRINAFASNHYQGSNNVVIAHELMHIFGAADKYDPRTNQPIYPIGYAEPRRKPLHPQRKAEIMGGRIPTSQSEAKMPIGLRQVVVGEATAAEIRWLPVEALATR